MEIRPVSWDDLEAVVEVIGTQSRAALGAAGIRTEQLRHEWSRPGFELGRDNVVAVDRGSVVGYAAVTPGHELVLAAHDDELADALLERVAARARGRGDATLSVRVSDAGNPLERLVRRHPFAPVAETLTMWRALDGPVEEPPAPPGIAIRTFEPRDALAVQELLDEAYGAWDARYAPEAHEAWVRRMTGDSEFEAEVWWLAERDGALAGCALHWSSGWLKDLAVRAAERGRGLGASLVGKGLAEFRRRGVRRVGLKVDAANPTGAIRLYERLGFVTARREAVWVWSL